MKQHKLNKFVCNLEWYIYISLNTVYICHNVYYICYILQHIFICIIMFSSGGSDGIQSAHNAGDPSSILGSGRSLGERDGNPLQDSCLENPMDRGTWRATIQGIAKSWTQLSDYTFTLDSWRPCDN